MKITAIIPSLYEVDGKYLKLAVESLRASVDWDIVVVTNGGRHKPDLSDIKGITVHLHTRDQGQCRAVNIGAQVASPDTDYLFISNSDMYYAPGWNRNLELLDPVVSPNLVEPVDNAGSAPPFLKVDGGLTLETFQQGLLDHFIAMHIDEDKTTEPGFNFPVFIKKDLWQFLDGYDIVFDPWGSNGDTDLQTRINLAGVTPFRLRDVLVYHFSNKSGTFDGTHQDFYVNNIDYFKDKFGFSRDDVPGCDVWYNTNMIPVDKAQIKFKQELYEAN